MKDGAFAPISQLRKAREWFGACGENAITQGADTHKWAVTHLPLSRGRGVGVRVLLDIRHI